MRIGFDDPDLATIREAVLDGQQPIRMYVIYHNPLDIPDAEYVVRQYDIVSGIRVSQGLLGKADILKEARKLIPSGLTNLGRHESDDNVIVESWA